MIIDPRSFTDGKELKIAYLKALADTLGGDIEVSLGDRLKMQGVRVYEGEIRLTLPKQERKEAKKQLKALEVKMLKEDLETYLRPSTVARLTALSGMKDLTIYFRGEEYFTKEDGVYRVAESPLSEPERISPDSESE